MDSRSACMATGTLWYSNTGTDAANWLTRYAACVGRTQPLLPCTHEGNRQWSETRLLPCVSKHGFPPSKVVIRKELTTHCRPPICEGYTLSYKLIVQTKVKRKSLRMSGPMQGKPLRPRLGSVPSSSSHVSFPRW